jgi:transcription-repair coupling factor (superfamily II helicase)
LSSEIKKKTNPNTVGCVAPQITTPLSTNIDESYVGSMSSRVDFYYRVGVASTSWDLEKIKRELIDVFGPIPQTTKNLISLAALRIAYTETPVVFIDCQNKEVNMVLESLEEKKLFMLLSVVGDFKNPKVSQLRFKERGDGRMGVVFVLFKSADFFEVLFSFVELFDIINKD